MIVMTYGNDIEVSTHKLCLSLIHMYLYPTVYIYKNAIHIHHLTLLLLLLSQVCEI